MSISAKYLLISAFHASRNPTTLDASLFDSTECSDSPERKSMSMTMPLTVKVGSWRTKDLFVTCSIEKTSERSKEQKESADQELIMKGPGTFPLERLIAIFQCISSVAEGSFDEDEHENDVLRVGADSGLMSDVLLQLSSLQNANFIIGGSCPLEGSTQ